MQPTQLYCVPIATRSLKPYVTHMSGGQDLVVSAFDEALTRNAVTMPRAQFTGLRSRLDTEGTKIPLIEKIKQKAPAVYIDLDAKLAFLVEWQEEMTAHYDELNSFMEQFPEDLGTLPEDQKQLFAKGFVELTFNYFANLAGIYSKHSHNLGMDVYNSQQEALSKVGFRQLSLIAHFYNAFEMAVNQMDRILFAEIPAKTQAKTLSMGDILSWKDTLIDVFFDARDKALELIDAR